MAAVDLASSHLSEELAEGDSYEPAASTLGSRYKRATRSRNTLPTNDDSSSDFKVVKLEVKAHSRPTGRSGLLAAQLKGYELHLPKQLAVTCSPLLRGLFAGLLHSRVCR